MSTNTDRTYCWGTKSMKSRRSLSIMASLVGLLLCVSAQAQNGIEESRAKQTAVFTGTYNNGVREEGRWGGVWLKTVTSGKITHQEIRLGIGRITGDKKTDNTAYTIQLPQQEAIQFQQALRKMLDAANRNRSSDPGLRTIRFSNPGLTIVYHEEGTNDFSVTLNINGLGLDRGIVIKHTADLEQLSTGLIAASQPRITIQRVPRFVMLSLAGSTLRKSGQPDTDEVIYDRARHYYLLRINDSDTRRLVLCPVMTEDWNNEIGPYKPRYVSLPSLSTEAGVSIGDSLQTVRAKLGKPTDTYSIRQKGDNEDTFFYQYFGGKLDGWSYIAWYNFQKGRLTEVSLTIAYGPEVPD